MTREQAVKFLLISIHALVKRATTNKAQFLTDKTDFNPRPREEGDRIAAERLYQRCNFNPRPREEGDQPRFILSLYSSYFNPRPREEGDSTFSP